MCAVFNPFDLLNEVRKDKGYDWSKINNISNDLFKKFKKGEINLDSSDEKLLRLAFFTALRIYNIIPRTSIRRIYNEITNIKNVANKDYDNVDEWEKKVNASINKAVATLSYIHRRESSKVKGKAKIESIKFMNNVLMTALSKTSIEIEKSTSRKKKLEFINSLYFFVQSIVAFYEFFNSEH